ncbi:histamine N-methyltransferase-like [Amphiura filiformis]|uniref:histamine N-methyltransferase-like n=1 Tax=Amphiura filiformis TaxID=82378 RepID=UPI003B20F3C9
MVSICIHQRHHAKAQCQDCRGTAARGRQLRTLGVGSGSGELECHILKQLLQKYPCIDNDIVEPSVELSAKYKNYVSANAADLKGIDCHWYELLLEDYQQKREKDGDSSKFHLISAIQSLYYFDDLGKCLDDLYGLLHEGGMLMIVLTTDTSAGGNLMKEFPILGSKASFEYSDVNASHVRRHFDNAGIHHYDYDVPIRIEITDCFAENPSPESDLLLDFASHCINFRKTSDDELRNSFLKFLGSDKCTEKRAGGRLFYKGDWGVTVIVK